jgi:hypothetical protein
MSKLSFPHLVATTLVATVFSATCLAGTAVFQESISDANGANAAYNMDVGYMTSGYGGPLQANDANHQIGGLNGASGRAVLRWPISTLAGKGTITGATAKITFNPVVRAEGNASVPASFAYNLYRLTDGNKQWIDSQVGNSQQKLGPSVPWTGSAGAGTPGVDYFATPVAQAIVSGGVDVMTKQVLTFNFTDTSFLQDWVNNPANNAGFLLRAESLETAGGYPNNGIGGYVQGTMYPDDVTTAPGRYPDAVAADRPILQVTYNAVPEPSTTLLVLSGTLIMLRRPCRQLA